MTLEWEMPEDNTEYIGCIAKCEALRDNAFTSGLILGSPVFYNAPIVSSSIL